MDDQLANLGETDRDLFPGSFTIRALRDSRYHNTAYAVAELIDNSIEAYAERIDLLCLENHVEVKSQTRSRLVELAVLDNGEGMTPRILLDALKFGGGTRHDSTQGIGKYGMGLPTSSMSQCTRVDVWTWQAGTHSVWHCGIDADEIEAGDHLVPFPDQKTPIPDVWTRAGNAEIFSGKTGTLVVWSKLDKIQWKTARALIDNTATEVGRIHRHYLAHDMVRIRAASFLQRRPSESVIEKSFEPNDPLYLIAPSATPEQPWNSKPMFQPWGDVRRYTVVQDGREATIEVRYSIVRPEALETANVGQLPGNTLRGRHARHNIGVSVVREDREIVLEDAFIREGGSADNPQNRWWGCEIQFFRACDDLFGLDHNKQMVTNFTQAAKTLARDDRPNQEILDEMGIEDDTIYQIVGDIRDQTRTMMRAISQMFAKKRDVGTSRSRRSPEKKAVKTATDADRSAIQAGTESPTSTDLDRERESAKVREDGLTQQFVTDGQPEQDARELARTLVSEALAYQFNSSQLDGYQMFNVRSNHGVLHVNLNTDHPVYDLLKHLESDIGEGADEDSPAFQAIVALRLLLSAWARMEDQTESRDRRNAIQDIAMNWGRQVDKVITQLRDRDG